MKPKATNQKLWFQRRRLYDTKVNWGSVISGGIVSLLVTSLWYVIYPLLSSWSPADLTQEWFIKDTAIVGIMLSLSLCLIISYIVHVIVKDKEISGIMNGLKLSLWIGVGLIIVSMLGGYLVLNVRYETVVIDLVAAYLRILTCCLWASYFSWKNYFSG